MENTPLQSAFGALPSPIDYRTVTADMLSGPSTIPGACKVPLNYPSVDQLSNQRKLGVCTDCSVRMGVEQHFKDGQRLDEYWGYLIGKVYIDKNLTEGSSALSMLKAAYNYGIPCTNVTAAYPLKTDGTYAEFIADFKARYGGKIPQAILDNAKIRKIPGYYNVAVNPLSIAAEISAGRIVLIRIECGDNFYTDVYGNPTWDAAKLLPLREPGYVVSGHLMAINEYSGLGAAQLEKGPNSWGPTWADNGYFSFLFNVQAPYHFTEAWAISSIPTHIIQNVTDLPEASTFSHTFTAPIQKGQSGPEVRALQVLLSILGLLSITVDELGTNFGPKTAAAVKAFQSKYAVASPAEIEAAGGNVGPKTAAKLNEVGKTVGSSIKKQ